MQTQTLYRKFILKTGGKIYVPTVGGKRRKAFKRASEAQAHSEAILARYARLKAVAMANMPGGFATSPVTHPTDV